MSKMNWRGPVIGQNATGYPAPVFYDPHTAINMENKPGGTIITGSPGSGKSHLGMTLAMISAVSGKQTVYWDPKNDSLGMRALKDELGPENFSIWNLNSEEEYGNLDPFLEPEKKKRIAKVTNLVELLVGQENLDPNQRNKLRPIISDVANDPDASMTKLVRQLRRSREPDIEEIGSNLQMIKDSSSMSNILFKQNNTVVHKKELSDGLTIITTFGLKLPSPNANPKNYRSEERLALAITYLITDFILQVMRTPSKTGVPAPKTVFIDEAWSVMQSEKGQDVVADLMRLGRSLNTACILMSQSVDDLDVPGGGVINAASNQFAFRALDHKEGLTLCKTLHISSAYADTFKDLHPGYCFFRDWRERVSEIYILQQNQKWTHAFETNPLKKAINAKMQAEEMNKNNASQ